MAKGLSPNLNSIGYVQQSAHELQNCKLSVYPVCLTSWIKFTSDRRKPRQVCSWESQDVGDIEGHRNTVKCTYSTCGIV